MTSRLTQTLLLASLIAGLGACAMEPRDRGTAAQQSACRQRADDVFARRNPADKYRTDQSVSSQRDAPFGGSVPADPTADLQARYARDQILGDCLKRANAKPAT